MSPYVPVERQPFGPTENPALGSWLERRNARTIPHLGPKSRTTKKPPVNLSVSISTGEGDVSATPPEKEGEKIEVLARIKKIVDKSDLEIVLAFPVMEKGGTVETTASCQMTDYGNKREGEVEFQGKKIAARDLVKFIMKDASVMATVYWVNSRVVSKGKRWKVVKFWKPNPNNNGKVYSVMAA